MQAGVRDSGPEHVRAISLPDPGPVAGPHALILVVGRPARWMPRYAGAIAISQRDAMPGARSHEFAAPTAVQDRSPASHSRISVHDAAPASPAGAYLVTPSAGSM